MKNIALEYNKNCKLILNDIEKEILILKASLEIIDSIVNYNILNLYHNDPYSEVKFNNYYQQQYFSIFLVDLLTPPRNNIFGLNELDYVSLLKNICSSPLFNIQNSIEYLNDPVADFYNWLETKITIEKMWFSSIELSIDLIITRKDFLYLGGNISKHNITRLSACAKKIQKILKCNGQDKELTECLLALEDFQNYFHGDGNILGYLSNAITEFLNNIRWGVYFYLKPESSRSHIAAKEGQCFYQCPDTISNPFIRCYYYDVMNMAGREPYMPKFKVSKYLKERY